MPPDITIFTPCSTDILSKVQSLRGKKSKNPEVGFGVVGIKTLTISSSEMFFISPRVGPVIKPITQIPFRGYSIRTTSRNAFADCAKTASKICSTIGYFI